MPKPTTPGAGKPTAKQINDIVAATQGGNPLPLVCRGLKLKQEHVEEWLQKGRESKPGTDLHAFAENFDAASALAEISLRKDLSNHAKTSPEAAFRLLELQAKDREAPKSSNLPLDNQFHEAFAQLIASGKKGGPAYREIAPNCTVKSAEASASRLLSNVKISARVTALQIASATRRCLTRERRLEVCHEVVESSTATHTDRLRAAKLDAELKGELIGKQDLTTNGEALPAVLPPIIINLPERFTRQRGTGKPA